MHKYGESKTTPIMMATVRHVTAWAGLRKFQADGFLLDRVYVLYQVPENFHLLKIIVSLSHWYNFSQSIRRFCLILNINCTFILLTVYWLYSSIVKTTLVYAPVTGDKNTPMHSAEFCGSLFNPSRSQATHAYSYANTLWFLNLDTVLGDILIFLINFSAGCQVLSIFYRHHRSPCCS